MIFVTCGTHEQPFDRLTKKMDELVEKKMVKDKVIAQIGHCTYKPKHLKYFKFQDFVAMDKLIDRSDILITHGGIGSLLLAMKKSKRTIAVPRMKKFKEHMTDHQIQVVKELEKQKRVIAVYEIENLLNAIKRAKRFHFKHRKKSNERFLYKIKKTLKSWEQV